MFSIDGLEELDSHTPFQCAECPSILFSSKLKYAEHMITIHSK